MNTENFIRCIRPHARRCAFRTVAGQYFSFIVSEGSLEFYPGCSCATLSVSWSEIDIAIERFTRNKDSNASLYADILKEPEFLTALMARLWQACIDEAGHVIMAAVLQFQIRLSTIDPERVVHTGLTNTTVALGYTDALAVGSMRPQAVHQILAGLAAVKMFGLASHDVDEVQADYNDAKKLVISSLVEMDHTEDNARKLADGLIPLYLVECVSRLSTAEHKPAVFRCASFLFENLSIVEDDITEQLAEFYKVPTDETLIDEAQKS